MNPIQKSGGIPEKSLGFSAAKPNARDQRTTKVVKKIFTKSPYLLAKQYAKTIEREWNLLEVNELAQKIISFQDKILPSLKPIEQKRLEKVSQRLHFAFVFPLQKELEKGDKQAPTFRDAIFRMKKEALQNESLEPFYRLSKTQQEEVLRKSLGGKMSPEGLSHAFESYIETLQYQASVAKSFFFGRYQEGMGGLLTLPQDVRSRVDQIVWEMNRGEALDVTEKDSQLLVAGALMRSIEERMGMED